MPKTTIKEYTFNIVIMRPSMFNQNGSVAMYQEDKRKLDFEFIGNRGPLFHYFSCGSGIDIYVNKEKKTRLINGETVKLFGKEYAG